LIQVL